VKIDRNTKIFGSFSSNPGNNGNLYFNEQFSNKNINALYKSFYSEDIKKSYEAAKTLSFGGFAVSMPFKREILNYIDVLTDEVQIIGACNTVKFKDGKSIGYNTDYLGVIRYLTSESNIDLSNIYILGDGGFAGSVKYALYKMGLDYNLITRSNWSFIPDLRDAFIINCTPVEFIKFHESCRFLDCLPTSETGKIIAKYQAEEQLKIYLDD
jgi:shikimate dehydrogenase